MAELNILLEPLCCTSFSEYGRREWRLLGNPEPESTDGHLGGYEDEREPSRVEKRASQKAEDCQDLVYGTSQAGLAAEMKAETIAQVNLMGKEKEAAEQAYPQFSHSNGYFSFLQGHSANLRRRHID